MKQRRYNLGCGHDVRPGWINVQHPDHPVHNPDDADLVYHDLTEIPWPIDDGAAEHVDMIEVLEHLPDPLEVFSELSRILGQGRTVRIVVPHALSPQGQIPWDHETYWTKRKLAWIADNDEHPDAANRRFSFELVRIGSDRSPGRILREWWNWGHPVRIEAVFRRVPRRP